MASRPKRKFITSREREILLQHFYDNTEEHEEQFLGHAFDKDGYSDSQFVQSGDNNEEKNGIADDTENCHGDILWIFSFESRKNSLENKISRT